jgi:hypothetical protein
MAVLKMKTITLDIRVALILGATGFGLELWALYLLGENMLFNALLVHFVAGLSTTYSLSQLMPQHFRTKPAVFFLFFQYFLVPLYC